MFSDDPFEILFGGSLQSGEDIFKAGIGMIKIRSSALPFQSCPWNVGAAFNCKDPDSLAFVKAKPPKIMARNKMLASLFRTHRKFTGIRLFPFTGPAGGFLMSQS
jgi:hypothetical protein